jgi:hypothetical protein
VKSLTTVSFENSSLSTDILDQVMKLENITYLDLSHNNIGPLNVSTFAKLKNLQALFLKDTNISQIVFGTFSHQNQLKTFDISDNNLGYFDMNMIFSMSSLLSLDISGNDLQTLDNVETSHYMFTLLAKIGKRMVHKLRLKCFKCIGGCWQNTSRFEGGGESPERDKPYNVFGKKLYNTVTRGDLKSSN